MVEAAVIGVSDTVRGTMPAAFVTLRTNASQEETIAGVEKAVEQAIGGFARLRSVYVSASLPKTRTGKIMRRLLREVAETGAITGDLTGLEDRSSLDAILAAVNDSKPT